MAAFVEEGFDVALHAGCVHEDEGLADFVEGGLVATGGFAFAGVEVEVFVEAEGVEVGGEGGGEAVEDFVGFLDETGDIGLVEGAEGEAGFDVDFGVPGAEGGEFECGGFFAVELADEGDDGFFDGVVEGEAVLGGVVEAFEGGPDVSAVVGEAGVLGDLLAEGEELVEEVVELFAVLDAAVGDGTPGAFAEGAVGFFEEAGGLGEGVVFAVDVGHLGAGDFVEFVGEAGDLGFEGDVFGAEDVDVGLPLAGEEEELGVGDGECGAVGGFEELFLEGEEEGFDVGFDVFDEMHELFFDGGVIGVAGFGDVEAGAVFVDDGGELGEIEEELVEVGGGGEGAVEERSVEGLEDGEVGDFEVGWDELAGGVCHGKGG